MKILVLDCKEYAIRYSLADTETETFPVCGKVESIGMAGAVVYIRTLGRPARQEVASLLTHRAAIEKITEVLVAEGGVRSADEIEAVAHRVVHGGELFQNSVLVDDNVIDEIQSLLPLAPLHNPAELEGIVAAREVLPKAPHVASFDTALYAGMPDYAFTYGLPFELYKRLGVRRYGFHGLSHGYLMHRAAQLMGKSVDEVNLVSCHLGSGCSVTAISKGIVQDTSMGFTPTEGLAMESRCGDIDPGLIGFLMAKERLSTKELLNLFNKFSGLKGLSGTSGEMKTILQEAAGGNQQAQLAIEVFCYRVKKYIAAYLGVLGGADAIVFSAGIGVNAPLIRAKCLEGMDFFGISLDARKNQETVGQEALISAPESQVKVYVIPDNEELTMALRTQEVITELQKQQEAAEA